VIESPPVTERPSPAPELSEPLSPVISADVFRERLALAKARLAKKKAAEAAAAAATDPLTPFRHADGTAIGLEDAGSSFIGQAPKSELVDRIEAMRADPILGVYRRLVGGAIPNAARDEVKVVCPHPDHPDHHPSANLNTRKNVWTCYRCGTGGSVFDLAAAAWGYSLSGGKLAASALWEVKKRYALEMHGLDYEFELAKQTADAAAAAMDAATLPPAPADSDSDWEAQVEKRTRETLIRLEGDDRARQRRAQGLFVPPGFVDDLASELAEGDPELEWTIDQLHTVGGNTTITAGFKVGKTTFVMNLIRALADQDPFLEQHEVRALSGRIAYWNFEVDPVQMKRNFRDLGIRNAARVWHLPLRGHRVNLMDDAAFTWTLTQMKRQEIEVWILDPFSGAYFGDENDNSEINAFTKRLDELKRLAGVADLFIPVHTGRFVEEGQERARGGAKLDDWTDNRWVLAKHAETGDRYFRAEGRRVEQGERELRYDRATNRLSYSAFGGTRKEKAGSVIRREVLTFIEANPGCGSLEIRRAGLGKTSSVIDVLKRLVCDLDVETRPGAKGKVCHYVAGTAPITATS
jgi:hypothetical protein